MGWKMENRPYSTPKGGEIIPPQAHIFGKSMHSLMGYFSEVHLFPTWMVGFMYRGALLEVVTKLYTHLLSYHTISFLLMYLPLVATLGT